MSVLRRYEAMDDLVARAREGNADIDYLADALDYYRTAYRDLLAERELIEQNARSFNLWRSIQP